MDPNQNQQQQPQQPPQGYPPQQPPQGYPPQQPPQGYPPQQPVYAPQQVSTSYPGKGLCIASLILGICSLVFFWTYGFTLAVVGLILGIIGTKKAGEVGAPSGMGKAGIILSAISLVIGLIFTIACASCAGALYSLM